MIVNVVCVDVGCERKNIVNAVCVEIGCEKKNIHVYVRMYT